MAAPLNIRARGWLATAGLAFVYAGLFAVLHDLGSWWGTSMGYSLWYPAAGVRFALLWHFGPRFAPVLAIAEVAGLMVSDRMPVTDQRSILLIASLAGPPLAYGASIHLFQKHFRSRLIGENRDTRLLLAVFATPLFGCAGSLPFRLVLGVLAVESFPDLVATILVFFLGDLLGLLLLAAPILWAIKAVEDRDQIRLGKWKQWAEAFLVASLCVLLIAAINIAGFGFRFQPILLATGWIGIRFGLRAAWVAILIAGAGILLVSSDNPDEGSRIGAHMLIAAIASMGYIAGTFSDAQKAMRAAIRRRDRLIFHAERLKTLKAMSVAIIHELSQPLSTLSIEARYLARLVERDSRDGELQSVAALVARKTENLSSLVRRLRSYGGRDDAEMETLPVDDLFHDVISVAASEARGMGVRLEIKLEQGLAVHGWRLELQQALLNLLRNAFAASPNSTVELTARRSSRHELELEVANRSTEFAGKAPGMGVGKLIVDAIAQAHGGRFSENSSAQGWRVAIILPSANRRAR